MTNYSPLRKFYIIILDPIFKYFEHYWSLARRHFWKYVRKRLNADAVSANLDYSSIINILSRNRKTIMTLQREIHFIISF